VYSTLNKSTNNQNSTKTLEGGCLVVHRSGLSFQHQGCLRWSRIAGPPEGSKKLSLFYFELETGNSKCLSFGESETVLYLVTGDLEITIADRIFRANVGSGVHIRAGEAFSMQNNSPHTARITATVCPGAAGFEQPSPHRNEFQSQYPDRVVDGGNTRKHASGDRFYRLLVSAHSGSENVTQFIGMIPRSKSPQHFHLYEEVIYILSGHGMMWAGESNTPVSEGSMIFLPIRQAHCLECSDPDGMLLMGSFYPAGSPAVNYASIDPDTGTEKI